MRQRVGLSCPTNFLPSNHKMQLRYKHGCPSASWKNQFFISIPFCSISPKSTLNTSASQAKSHWYKAQLHAIFWSKPNFKSLEIIRNYMSKTFPNWLPSGSLWLFLYESEILGRWDTKDCLCDKWPKRILECNKSAAGIQL